MLAAIITVLIIVADQVSKYFVVKSATPVDVLLDGKGVWTKSFIPKILSLDYEENTGAAFSMFSEPNQRWIFMLFSFISMGIIVFLLVKEYKRHPLLTVSLSMVLGGGIGNMIDRIRLGYVVDFFHVDFFEFAVFNVADSFVSVGAVLLAVYVLFFEGKVEKRLQAAEKAVEQLTDQPDETALEPLKENETTPAEEPVKDE